MATRRFAQFIVGCWLPWLVLFVAMSGSDAMSQSDQTTPDPEPNPYPAGTCLKIQIDCWGSCGSWQWICVAVPTSLRPVTAIQDPDGMEHGGGNCGTCVYFLWPHVPKFEDCGPPLGVVQCI